MRVLMFVGFKVPVSIMQVLLICSLFLFGSISFANMPSISAPTFTGLDCPKGAKVIKINGNYLETQLPTTIGGGLDRIDDVIYGKYWMVAMVAATKNPFDGFFTCANKTLNSGEKSWLPHGPFVVIGNDSKVTIAGQFFEGRLSGPFVLYSPWDNRILMSVHFVNGLNNGPRTLFDHRTNSKAGRIVQRSYFIKGTKYLNQEVDSVNQTLYRQFIDPDGNAQQIHQFYTSQVQNGQDNKKALDQVAYERTLKGEEVILTVYESSGVQKSQDQSKLTSIFSVTTHRAYPTEEVGVEVQDPANLFGQKLTTTNTKTTIRFTYDHLPEIFSDKDFDDSLRADSQRFAKINAILDILDSMKLIVKMDKTSFEVQFDSLDTEVKTFGAELHLHHAGLGLVSSQIKLFEAQLGIDLVVINYSLENLRFLETLGAAKKRMALSANMKVTGQLKNLIGHIQNLTLPFGRAEASFKAAQETYIQSLEEANGAVDEVEAASRTFLAKIDQLEVQFGEALRNNSRLLDEAVADIDLAQQHLETAEGIMDKVIEDQRAIQQKMAVLQSEARALNEKWAAVARAYGKAKRALSQEVTRFNQSLMNNDPAAIALAFDEVRKSMWSTYSLP